MNELHRDPPRWLESGFLSEELASELAAYGAEAAPAASKLRMLEQLEVAEVVAPAATTAVVKLKLFVAGAAILAGAVGFLQFTPPVPAQLQAREHDRAEATRLAPLDEIRLAAAPVEEIEVVEDVQIVKRAARRELPLRVVVTQEPPVQAKKPDVLAELTMLAHARRALLNDPARALELSDEHARTYPRGTFDEEREVLAIESLLKLGRRDEARARERAFELRFPRSAQIAHLAKLIAKPSP